MYKVYLKPGKEESLKRFHPWVFSGAIAHFDGEPEEGEVVEIYTSKKEFIAKGHFQIGSIAVRVLSFCRDEAIDAGFWKRKLSIAYDMRRSIGIAGNPTNNTYRLVHGEGDNLPGLVIDIYARTAVMQAHSAGMHLDRMAIADALTEVMGDQIDNIYYKSETTLPFKADLYPENGFLKGGSADNIAMEYGLKFHIDWLKGQKTGFFVDQRENRSLLERYANGRSVLNMFCYTGGFSVYAMRGNATLVHSVDSSAKAIDLTNKNIELNFPGDNRHAAYAEDAFKYLDRMGQPTGNVSSAMHKSSPEKESTEHERLSEILKFLEFHICEKLTVSDICDTFSISRSALQSLFHEQLDCGVIDHFNKMKIQRAKDIICDGSMNLTEIAYFLSYSSLPYFSKQFRIATGMSPSAYASSVKGITDALRNSKERERDA